MNLYHYKIRWWGFVPQEVSLTIRVSQLRLVFLPVTEINDSAEVQIEIMGRQKLAKILTKPIFDSNNSKMRN